MHKTAQLVSRGEQTTTRGEQTSVFLKKNFCKQNYKMERAPCNFKHLPLTANKSHMICPAPLCEPKSQGNAKNICKSLKSREKEVWRENSNKT